jgi:hypothetical protein
MHSQRSATLGSVLAAVGAVWALSCGSRSAGVPVNVQLWRGDTVVAQMGLATGVDGTVAVEEGESLRLMPSLQSSVLAIRVRRTGAHVRPAGNTPEALLRFKASRRVAIPGSAFAIEWLGSEAVGSGAAKRTTCSRCCITCTGVTVCACRVTMACGGCACNRGCTASAWQRAPLFQSLFVAKLWSPPPRMPEG